MYLLKVAAGRYSRLQIARRVFKPPQGETLMTVPFKIRRCQFAQCRRVLKLRYGNIAATVNQTSNSSSLVIMVYSQSFSLIWRSATEGAQSILSTKHILVVRNGHREIFL